MNVKSNIKQAAIASALPAVVVFASGTVVYFKNLPEFCFTLSQCLVFLSFFTVIVFLAFFIPLLLMRNWKKFDTACLNVFWVGLCMWIQGFFMIYPVDMSQGLQSSLLYGFIVFWEVFIYLAVLFVLHFFRSFVLTNMPKLLMIVVVTQIIVTFPDAIMYKECYLGRVPEFSPVMTNSSDQNIIIVLVDSTGTDIFDELLKAHPECRENLRDFEYFHKLMSLMPFTLYAVPTLFSGNDYFDKTMKWSRYLMWVPRLSAMDYENTVNQMYQDSNALIPKLNEKGYVSAFYPYANMERYFPRDYVFENLSYTKDESLKRKFFNMQVVTEGFFTSTLQRITPLLVRDWIGRKMGPIFCKVVLRKNNNSCPGIVIDPRDRLFMEHLTDSQCDDKKHFNFVHLWGTHIFDDYPKEKVIPYEKMLFDGLTKYLDHLKATGCYDNSWIIIMGDHGQHRGKVQYHFNPVFLIKRPHAQNETIQVNENIILMRDIAPSLLGELGIQTERPFSIWNQTEEQKKERQELWQKFFVENIQ